MSFNKSWTQVAAGKTAERPPTMSSNLARQSNTIDLQPILYQPLTPALATLDIRWLRCKQNNHPLPLENLADNERRPTCAESDVGYPLTSAATAPSANTRATPARKDMARQIVDSPSIVSLHRDGAGVVVPSIDQPPPDGPSATTEPPEAISPQLQEDLPMPPSCINILAGEHVVWPSSHIQPDIDSPEFPDVAFFRDLKQKSRAAISTELFEGSIPDDTSKDRHRLQAPIGSAASMDADKEDRLHTQGPSQDWSQTLSTQGGTVPSILHNFKEDLAREFEATMIED